jgi:hypothetical protein
MADRLGQVAADRVIPIGNHTIIGGFSLAAFALRTAGPTSLTAARVPKHVPYQATLLPAFHARETKVPRGRHLEE